MVEIMKITGTSFKKSCACAATLSAPDPTAGHHRPTPPPETPGHSQQMWGSFLWGHCSLLLGPGVHRVSFVPSKSLFPQSCVSSCGSMVGLMATSSKRAYAIPRSTAPRVPAAGHPFLHRRHSDTVLAQSLWVGHVFCALPGLSSSCNQVLGERIVPGEPCVLITYLVLAARFLWCTMRAPFQVCRRSPLES